MTLLAWWMLNEADKNDPSLALDSSGNGYDGEYLGPTVGEGDNSSVTGWDSIADGALSVNVPTTYPDPHDLYSHAGVINSAADWSFSGVQPFTVDFMLRIPGGDPVQNRGLLGSLNPASPPGEYSTWGFYIPSNTTQVRFYRGDFNIPAPNLDYVETPSLSTNTWTRIRGIYDGTNQSIYMDGVLQDSMVSTVTDVAAGASYFTIGGTLLNVIFGQKTYRYPVSGTYFDDVRIWDTITMDGPLSTIKACIGENI